MTKKKTAPQPATPPKPKNVVKSKAVVSISFKHHPHYQYQIRVPKGAKADTPILLRFDSNSVKPLREKAKGASMEDFYQLIAETLMEKMD